MRRDEKKPIVRSIIAILTDGNHNHNRIFPFLFGTLFALSFFFFIPRKSSQPRRACVCILITNLLVLLIAKRLPICRAEQKEAIFVVFDGPRLCVYVAWWFHSASCRERVPACVCERIASSQLLRATTIPQFNVQ